MNTKRVKLICEICGQFDELEGDSLILHIAIEELTQDHWRIHVPSVRYDWEEIESKTSEKKYASLAEQILHLPMEGNDANAATVGEYLSELTKAVWVENEGFSGKRPFGNSGWQTEVYEALGRAGLIDISFDEDGYIDHLSYEEERKADKLILQAIKVMYND